jgi:hypothetical protein
MTGVRPERSAGLEIERHRTPTPRRRQADPPAAPRSRWWPARRWPHRGGRGVPGRPAPPHRPPQRPPSGPPGQSAAGAARCRRPGSRRHPARAAPGRNSSFDIGWRARIRWPRASSRPRTMTTLAYGSDRPRLRDGRSTARTRRAPRSPRQPPPQASPTHLSVLLAVPEPAQPARLGVAIKEPPRVRLSILGLGRVSVAVRHSILPNRQRQAAPARLAAWYTGRTPRPDDHGRGIEPAWHTRPTSYLAPTKPVNTRLKSLQPAKA